MLDGIIHRMRSGCQWNHLPKSRGSDRTAHRYFQRWVNNGVLQRIWKKLIQACNELGGGMLPIAPVALDYTTLRAADSTYLTRHGKAWLPFGSMH